MLRTLGGRVVVGLVMVALAGTAHAQPRPCDAVTCSGHGECIPESTTAYCLCEEGYMAVDRSCVAAPQPAQRVLRSSSVGWRIAELASAEADRELPDVGKSLNQYPYALARYVAPDGLWCSDFVSWVYRAAGAPFTGGYQGGWLITNNFAIRRWFQQRNLWVGRGSAEYAHFEPRPGDYVRIHTPRWGHSAIVRYIEGDRIYLIEGNAGRRVRLTHYDHWRQYERFDGFGIVTLPEVRRVQASAALAQPPRAG